MNERQIKVVTILAAVLAGLVALITLVEAPEDTGEAEDEDAESFVELAPDLEAAGVEVVQLAQGAQVIRFERADGAWMIREPVVAPADSDAVEAFLDRMLRIELGEGMETTELSAFGLEPPGTVLTLTAQGDQSVRLEVGDEAPVGYRTYVRTSDGLVRATRARLGPAFEVDLSDFRQKRLVPSSVSEAQAMELEHAGVQLRLERIEDRWQMGGAEPVAVDGEAVQRLLQRLGSLEVAEFPDPAPPTPDVWSIQVQTDAGPTVLHLGQPDADGLVVASAPLQEQPVLVSAALLEGLSVEPASWQSRRLMEFFPGRLQRVKLVLGELSLESSRTANGWEPDSGEALVEALDAVRVDRSAAVELPKAPEWGLLELEDSSGEVQRRTLIRDEAGNIWLVEGARAIPVAPTEVQRLEQAAG